MLSRIIGYSLLSLFSFFFFSGFFYVAVNAQAEGGYQGVVSEGSVEPDLALLEYEAAYVPTPTPTKIPVFVSQAPVTEAAPITGIAPDLDALFAKYSGEYGVDAELMKKIARCESGFNPNSVGGGGLYKGMFQFMEGTWVSTRRSMGLDSDPNLRYDAEEAIRTSSYMVSQGRQNAWPVCSKK